MWNKMLSFGQRSLLLSRRCSWGEQENKRNRLMRCASLTSQWNTEEIKYEHMHVYGCKHPRCILYHTKCKQSLVVFPPGKVKGNVWISFGTVADCTELIPGVWFKFQSADYLTAAVGTSWSVRLFCPVSSVGNVYQHVTHGVRGPHLLLPIPAEVVQ